MSAPNSTLSLLQRADSLAQTFNNHHRSSTSLTSNIAQLASQQSSVLAYPPTPDPAQQQHVLAALQESIEGALSGVRDHLQAMEGVVEQLKQLLFDVDLFLSNPGQYAGVSSFDPQHALAKISDLFNMYQTELISKRELLADYTCEEMDANAFAAGWAEMLEVNRSAEEEIGDLADILSKMS